MKNIDEFIEWFIIWRIPKIPKYLNLLFQMLENLETPLYINFHLLLSESIQREC